MTDQFLTNRRLARELRQVIRENEQGKGPALYAGGPVMVRVYQVRLSRCGLALEARSLATGDWFFVVGFEVRK